MTLGKVRSMSGELVGDDPFPDILAVRQTKVFLGGDVAEHGATVPANHGGPDPAGDVVVSGGHVGGQGTERVKGSLVTPFELLFHVLLDHVHRHVSRPFVHDLHPEFPSPGGQFSLSLEFGKLGLVVGICDRARP